MTNEIKAAFIIDNKNNKASTIINNWFNPLLDNAINISEVFCVEAGSDDELDKEDEIFEMAEARIIL